MATQLSESHCDDCNDFGMTLNLSEYCLSVAICNCQRSMCTNATIQLAETINRAGIPSVIGSDFFTRALDKEVIVRWASSVINRSYLRSTISICATEKAEALSHGVQLLKTIAKGGISSIAYIDCDELVPNLEFSRFNAKDKAYFTKLERLFLRTEVLLINNIPAGKDLSEHQNVIARLIQKRHLNKLLMILIPPKPLLDEEALLSKIVHKSMYVDLDKFEELTQVKNSYYVLDNNIRVLPNTTTFVDIWAREGLFRMVSKSERAKLTKKSNINPKEVIDCSSKEPREFISWSGCHVVLNGPIVDYDDANVLAAIISIYHGSGKNGKVVTTISKIASIMQYEKATGNVNKLLKRSLIRLAESRITMRSKPKQDGGKTDTLWVGGFIDSIKYHGDKRTASVTIEFNEAMAPFYEKDAYSYASLPILVNVSQYAQGIYRFLNSHRDDYKYISLTKWREILGINPETKTTSYRDRMCKAIKELIKEGILGEKSTIDRSGVFHSYLNRDGILQKTLH